MFIQSVGINPTASRYAGINVALIIFLVYAFSGFCAGVSGLIESSLIRAADANNAGLNMEMDAILAVALGGTLLSGGKFYIGGSIIGAITIQTLTTTMYAMGVASDQLPVVKAIVVIILCLIQSKHFREIFNKSKKIQQRRWIKHEYETIYKFRNSLKIFSIFCNCNIIHSTIWYWYSDV